MTGRPTLFSVAFRLHYTILKPSGWIANQVFRSVALALKPKTPNISLNRQIVVRVRLRTRDCPLRVGDVDEFAQRTEGRSRLTSGDTLKRGVLGPADSRMRALEYR
jgi:hypothetical protein